MYAKGDAVMDIKSKILSIISDDVLQDTSKDLDFLYKSETRLTDILDSISLVKLLVALEDKFDISLDDELSMENFTSLDSLQSMIERVIG